MSVRGYAFSTNTDQGPNAVTLDLTELFENYLLSSCRDFPLPAGEEEVAVIRACVAAGLSPKDVLVIYMQVLFNITTAGVMPATSAPPSLFLASVLVHLLEEYQLMYSTNYRPAD